MSLPHGSEEDTQVSRRVPRKDAPGSPHDADPADEGGFDEVAFGGAEPLDPGNLLGPVDEFTLSIPMEGTHPGLPTPIREADRPRPPPEPEPRSAPPARREPDPPPRAAALPPKRRVPLTQRRSEPDPLTTGVIPQLDLTDPLGDLPPDRTVLLSLSRPPPPMPAGPAPSIGDATAALMLDGLDGDDVSLHLAEPSVGLPEVVMPPPDTARARPLRSDGKPPVISLEPQPAPRPEELEWPRPPQPPRAQPSPGAPRAEAWRPASRARPEGRPDAAPREDTNAVSFGGPPPVAERPPPPPPARPESPSTAAVQRLGSLLTLADEPPEREETLSSSLELLSLADEPPEREETIGAALVPLATEAPRRAPAAPPPPMEDQVSLDDLELPPSSPAELPPAGEGVDEVPFGHMETRPISPEALAAALHHRPQVSETRHAEPAGQSARSGEFVRPPHVKPLQTAQLRRETYRPANGTTPPAPAAKPGASTGPRSVPPPPAQATPAPAPRAPTPEPPSSPQPGLNAEPVLMWAATLIGMLILGSFAFLLLVLITYLV